MQSFNGLAKMSTIAQVTTVRLLDIAVDLAEEVGFDNITRDAIARKAGVSLALPSIRLGNKSEMLRNIMRHAISRRSLPVVAQGLASGHKAARRAPADLKAEAAAWLAGR